MKKRACEKLATALLPYLPSYSYEKKANAISKVPVGNVFRGMLFSSSGFSAEAFYPEVFVQPLYVPVEYFTLNFGMRLLGNWQYEPGQEESLAKRLVQSMEREGALELLDDLASPERLVRNLSRYHSNPQEPYLQQAIAYSFAVCGQYDEALHWLDQCRATTQEMQLRDPGRKWRPNFLDEVTRFRELVASDPEAAVKQLDEWTEYTRSHLGLLA